MAVDDKIDIEQRTAILRRFRELLLQQRAKFEHYLEVIDHEKADIESGDIDKLIAHVELEEQVVSEIITFQKVIDPLESLYHAAYAASADGQAPEQGELPELKRSLVELRGEVLKRNAENRILLKKRMEAVRSEIAGLRMPMKARRSVYAEAGEAAIIDVQG